MLREQLSKTGAGFVASDFQLRIGNTEHMHVPQIGCRPIAGPIPTVIYAHLSSVKSFPAGGCLDLQHVPPMAHLHQWLFPKGDR